VLHAERARFALLYRLLWRLQREPSLRDDVLDSDMALARRMAHAVTHEMHKMKAFVRFRPLRRRTAVSRCTWPWFEPSTTSSTPSRRFSCAASPACAGPS
jgi:DNA polymerase